MVNNTMDLLNVLMLNLSVKVIMTNVPIVVLTTDIVMMENVNVVLDSLEMTVLNHNCVLIIAA